MDSQINMNLIKVGSSRFNQPRKVLLHPFAPVNGDVSHREHPEMLGDGLDWSTVHDTLSHRRRRALLKVLDRNEEPFSLQTAAEAVVRLLSETPIDEISQKRIERCEIAFHHRHIPMLAEEGLVTMGDESLSLTEKGEQLVEAQIRLEQSNFD